MVLSVDDGYGNKTTYQVTKVVDSATLEIGEIQRFHLLRLEQEMRDRIPDAMLRPSAADLGKHKRIIRRKNAPYKDIE
jgi:hypothetical protein